jgi:hypothetical protein
MVATPQVAGAWVPGRPFPGLSGAGRRSSGVLSAIVTVPEHSQCSFSSKTGSIQSTSQKRTKLFLASRIWLPHPACTEGATQGERTATPRARPRSGVRPGDAPETSPAASRNREFSEQSRWQAPKQCDTRPNGGKKPTARTRTGQHKATSENPDKAVPAQRRKPQQTGTRPTARTRTGPARDHRREPGQSGTGATAETTTNRYKANARNRSRPVQGQRREPGAKGGPPGGSGGSPPRASTPRGSPGNWPRGPVNSVNYRVGEEGFEPSRPFGHTDLNRARLPFRHPPWAGSKG